MRRLFIIRKDLNMSPGKLAAQVGHCAEAYWTNFITNQKASCKAVGYVFVNLAIPLDIYEEYIKGSFVKIVCQARNKNHLLKAVDIAEELGLERNSDYGLIYDNCLTELTPEEVDGTTLTGIWFKPLPDETAHKISQKYHLYT